MREPVGQRDLLVVSNVLLTSLGDHFSDKILNASAGGVLGAAAAIAPTLGPTAHISRIIDALVIDFRAVAERGAV